MDEEEQETSPHQDQEQQGPGDGNVEGVEGGSEDAGDNPDSPGRGGIGSRGDGAEGASGDIDEQGDGPESVSGGRDERLGSASVDASRLGTADGANAATPHVPGLAAVENPTPVGVGTPNEANNHRSSYGLSSRGSEEGNLDSRGSNFGGPASSRLPGGLALPSRFDDWRASRGGSGSSRHSRPGSAVVDVRGSRPNSAAIAQEIEGFEDDFMERVDEEDDEAFDDQYEEEEQDMGPTVEELIDRASEEQQRLMEANEAMQRRVRQALDFRNKGRPQVQRDLSRLDGAATRYKASLKQWIDVLEERDNVEAHYQSTIFDMKRTLEERIKRADDITKAYKHFRLEVAKSAEHSKTGRPISEKLLAQLEREDQEKEEEVQRVRLKNIHLTNQLRRIEQTLRQKEELAEGLHLIDFEQLKIENQSLNEKIEERNEELLKLRKKTTTTVQILTHVREKLQFIEKENTALTAQLEALERELADKRDRLGRAKAARDTLRQKGRKIKESSVYITNPGLLDDIEAQKEKREQQMSEIEDLRHEYGMLADTVSRTTTKLMSMAEDMAAGAPPTAAALSATARSSTSVVTASPGRTARSGGPKRSMSRSSAVSVQQ